LGEEVEVKSSKKRTAAEFYSKYKELDQLQNASKISSKRIRREEGDSQDVIQSKFKPTILSPEIE
jgi:hypothetical protein